MPEWVTVLWWIFTIIFAFIGSIAFWTIYSEEKKANHKRRVKNKFGALKPEAAGVLYILSLVVVAAWPLAVAGGAVYLVGKLAMGIPQALQFLIGSAHDIKTSR